MASNALLEAIRVLLSGGKKRAEVPLSDDIPVGGGTRPPHAEGKTEFTDEAVIKQLQSGGGVSSGSRALPLHSSGVGPEDSFRFGADPLETRQAPDFAVEKAGKEAEGLAKVHAQEAKTGRPVSTKGKKEGSTGKSVPKMSSERSLLEGMAEEAEVTPPRTFPKHPDGIRALIAEVQEQIDTSPFGPSESTLSYLEFLKTRLKEFDPATRVKGGPGNVKSEATPPNVFSEDNTFAGPQPGTEFNPIDAKVRPGDKVKPGGQPANPLLEKGESRHVLPAKKRSGGRGEPSTDEMKGPAEGVQRKSSVPKGKETMDAAETQESMLDLFGKEQAEDVQNIRAILNKEGVGMDRDVAGFEAKVATKARQVNEVRKRIFEKHLDPLTRDLGVPFGSISKREFEALPPYKQRMFATRRDISQKVDAAWKAKDLDAMLAIEDRLVRPLKGSQGTLNLGVSGQPVVPEGARTVFRTKQTTTPRLSEGEGITQDMIEMLKSIDDVPPEPPKVRNVGAVEGPPTYFEGDIRNFLRESMPEKSLPTPAAKRPPEESELLNALIRRTQGRVEPSEVTETFDAFLSQGQTPIQAFETMLQVVN